MRRLEADSFVFTLGDLALCLPLPERDHTRSPYITNTDTKEPRLCKFSVTLQLTVSQFVCLGVEPRLGLMTRSFFLFESYCPVQVGRPL
jgi:hypothetical protein